MRGENLNKTTTKKKHARWFQAQLLPQLWTVDHQISQTWRKVQCRGKGITFSYPGFQSFSGFLHYFALAEIATSSIRVKSCVFLLPVWVAPHSGQQPRPVQGGQDDEYPTVKVLSSCFQFGLPHTRGSSHGQSRVARMMNTPQ